MPKVSVIIPSYNHGQYISEAIHSVLDQTMQDFEIIVVDDGSTDNTAAVLQTFQDQIRYVRRRTPSGPGAAKNCGIRLSEADYIATLDADDIWFPQKLDAQVQLMDARPEVGLCFANVYNFDTNSRQTWPQSGFDLLSPHSGHVLGQLLCQNFIPSQSVMIRRKCLARVGLFDESLRIGEDWHLWLRLAAAYRVDYLNMPVAGRRLHNANLTRDEPLKLLNSLLIVESMLRCFRERLSAAELENATGLMLNRRLALIHEYIIRGEPQFARAECWKAWRMGTRGVSVMPYFLLSMMPVGFVAMLRDVKRGLRQRRSRPTMTGAAIDEIRSALEKQYYKANTEALQ
jgi:glycosyltransferase involved in cell wall biosynthesis